MRAVRQLGGLEVHTVSGDVQAERVSGDARVYTVSGDVNIDSSANRGALIVNTTSGDLAWSGRCGAGCVIRARSTSGDLRLDLDPSSSFELRYLTHSGELSDELGMIGEETRKALPKGGETSVRARAGSGEGSIDVASFSGDLQVRRR